MPSPQKKRKSVTLLTPHPPTAAGSSKGGSTNKPFFSSKHSFKKSSTKSHSKSGNRKYSVETNGSEEGSSAAATPQSNVTPSQEFLDVKFTEEEGQKEALQLEDTEGAELTTKNAAPVTGISSTDKSKKEVVGEQGERELKKTSAEDELRGDEEGSPSGKVSSTAFAFACRQLYCRLPPQTQSNFLLGSLSVFQSATSKGGAEQTSRQEKFKEGSFTEEDASGGGWQVPIAIVLRYWQELLGLENLIYGLHTLTLWHQQGLVSLTDLENPNVTSSYFLATGIFTSLEGTSFSFSGLPATATVSNFSNVVTAPLPGMIQEIMATYLEAMKDLLQSQNEKMASRSSSGPLSGSKSGSFYEVNEDEEEKIRSMRIRRNSSFFQRRRRRKSSTCLADESTDRMFLNEDGMPEEDVEDNAQPINPVSELVQLLRLKLEKLESGIGTFNDNAENAGDSIGSQKIGGGRRQKGEQQSEEEQIAQENEFRVLESEKLKEFNAKVEAEILSSSKLLVKLDPDQYQCLHQHFQKFDEPWIHKVEKDEEVTEEGEGEGELSSTQRSQRKKPDEYLYVPLGFPPVEEDGFQLTKMLKPLFHQALVCAYVKVIPQREKEVGSQETDEERQYAFGPRDGYYFHFIEYHIIEAQTIKGIGSTNEAVSSFQPTLEWRLATLLNNDTSVWHVLPFQLAHFALEEHVGPASTLSEVEASMTPQTQTPGGTRPPSVAKSFGDETGGNQPFQVTSPTIIVPPTEEIGAEGQEAETVEDMLHMFARRNLSVNHYLPSELKVRYARAASQSERSGKRGSTQKDGSEPSATFDKTVTELEMTVGGAFDSTYRPSRSEAQSTSATPAQMTPATMSLQQPLVDEGNADLGESGVSPPKATMIGEQVDIFRHVLQIGCEIFPSFEAVLAIYLQPVLKEENLASDTLRCSSSNPLQLGSFFGGDAEGLQAFAKRLLLTCLDMTEASHVVISQLHASMSEVTAEYQRFIVDQDQGGEISSYPSPLLFGTPLEIFFHDTLPKCGCSDDDQFINNKSEERTRGGRRLASLLIRVNYLLELIVEGDNAIASARGINAPPVSLPGEILHIFLRFLPRLCFLQSRFSHDFLLQEQVGSSLFLLSKILLRHYLSECEERFLKLCATLSEILQTGFDLYPHLKKKVGIDQQGITNSKVGGSKSEDKMKKVSTSINTESSEELWHLFTEQFSDLLCLSFLILSSENDALRTATFSTGSSSHLSALSSASAFRYHIQEMSHYSAFASVRYACLQIRGTNPYIKRNSSSSMTTLLDVMKEIQLVFDMTTRGETNPLCTSSGHPATVGASGGQGRDKNDRGLNVNSFVGNTGRAFIYRRLDWFFEHIPCSKLRGSTSPQGKGGNGEPVSSNYLDLHETLRLQLYKLHLLATPYEERQASFMQMIETLFSSFFSSAEKEDAQEVSIPSHCKFMKTALTSLDDEILRPLTTEENSADTTNPSGDDGGKDAFQNLKQIQKYLRFDYLERERLLHKEQRREVREDSISSSSAACQHLLICFLFWLRCASSLIIVVEKYNNSEQKAAGDSKQNAIKQVSPSISSLCQRFRFFLNFLKTIVPSDALKTVVRTFEAVKIRGETKFDKLLLSPHLWVSIFDRSCRFLQWKHNHSELFEEDDNDGLASSGCNFFEYLLQGAPPSAALTFQFLTTLEENTQRKSRHHDQQNDPPTFWFSDCSPLVRPTIWVHCLEILSASHWHGIAVMANSLATYKVVLSNLQSFLIRQVEETLHVKSKEAGASQKNTKKEINKSDPHDDDSSQKCFNEYLVLASQCWQNLHKALFSFPMESLMVEIGKGAKKSTNRLSTSPRGAYVAFLMDLLLQLLASFKIHHQHLGNDGEDYAVLLKSILHQRSIALQYEELEEGEKNNTKKQTKNLRLLSTSGQQQKNMTSDQCGDRFLQQIVRWATWIAPAGKDDGKAASIMIYHQESRQLLQEFGDAFFLQEMKPSRSAHFPFDFLFPAKRRFDGQRRERSHSRRSRHAEAVQLFDPVFHDEGINAINLSSTAKDAWIRDVRNPLLSSTLSKDFFSTLQIHGAATAAASGGGSISFPASSAATIGKKDGDFSLLVHDLVCCVFGFQMAPTTKPHHLSLTAFDEFFKKLQHIFPLLPSREDLYSEEFLLLLFSTIHQLNLAAFIYENLQLLRDTTLQEFALPKSIVDHLMNGLKPTDAMPSLQVLHLYLFVLLNAHQSETSFFSRSAATRKGNSGFALSGTTVLSRPGKEGQSQDVISLLQIVRRNYASSIPEKERAKEVLLRVHSLRELLLDTVYRLKPCVQYHRHFSKWISEFLHLGYLSLNTATTAVDEVGGGEISVMQVTGLIPAAMKHRFVAHCLGQMLRCPQKKHENQSSPQFSSFANGPRVHNNKEAISSWVIQRHIWAWALSVSSLKECLEQVAEGHHTCSNSISRETVKNIQESFFPTF